MFTNNTKRLLRDSINRTLEELRREESRALTEYRVKEHQANEAGKRLATIRRDIDDAKASLIELRAVKAEPSTPLAAYDPKEA